MNTITFQVTPAEQIPPLAKEKSMIAHNCSEWYMAKIETIGGNVRFDVVTYNFTYNKWLSVTAGLKRVIEYYTEL
jgi:hypothetical protein